MSEEVSRNPYLNPGAFKKRELQDLHPLWKVLIAEFLGTVTYFTFKNENGNLFTRIF